METTWLKCETILCTIKYNLEKKTLTLYPDFSKTHPYDLEINGNTARHFKYYIDHVSPQIPDEENEKEMELIKKINNHKIQLVKQLIGTNFTLPPKNKLRFNFIFEISCAQNFENSSAIFVKYFIDLPPYWSNENNRQLQGVTQTSRSKKGDLITHFNHIFEVVLDYDLEHLNSGLPQPPYIYFEVISKDYWDRYRCEGLTYKNLPIKPGNYRCQMNCFRLLPGVSGRLRRFFIGDCSGYDVTWIGMPPEFDVSSTFEKCQTPF